MTSFSNPSFERLIEGTLKRSSAALRDAGIPYCLMGSLAAWVRGGPESSHDLDFGIRAADMIHAAEALEGIGFTVEIPPEEWLIKAWDGEPGLPESTLVDLIYAPSGMPITDEVLARAETMQVLAQSMPVISPTDLMVTKLNSIREQSLNYTSAMGIARGLREQVDWDDVRGRTERSPYAAAFFTMAELLGVAPRAGSAPAPHEPLVVMQAAERKGDEWLQERSRLEESLRQRGLQPRNGHQPETRSAQTMA